MGIKSFTHKSPTHSQEILERLNTLRSDRHFCDVDIRVQGKLFAAHRVVLACCSDFLQAKLSARPCEEYEGAGEDDKPILDLEHVTVVGFAPLLEYAYTSTLDISTENVIDVLAAASYMQMFAVANICSEFMKSSILWHGSGGGGGGLGMGQHSSGGGGGGLGMGQQGGGLGMGQQGGGLGQQGGGLGMGQQGGGLGMGMGQQEKAQDNPDGSAGCGLATLDALSPSPVSSECSVLERAIPIYRESRRKRKSFTSPLVPSCSSSQVHHPSPSSASFPESSVPPMDPSLACIWTYPFGVDRRFSPEKPMHSEGPLELSPGPDTDPNSRVTGDYLACEGLRGVESDRGAALEEEEEDDVHVKVERLSDEEVQEEVLPQCVGASHCSLSDQQTVPGSEHTQEDLLTSPQSSSIGSIDEVVSDGLQTIQSTANTSGHVDDDERMDGIQYPYHLFMNTSTRPGLSGPERPFQCPTCGVGFTRVQNLKQHMLIHSGIKPFQCDRCGKKFTRAYSLKMHRLKHEVSSSSQST